jgi:Ser/Thr protein kinase RdoA (MazF antagonist)
MQAPGSFDMLTPHLVTAAVEEFFDLSLDGTVDRYASYVNRVYGLSTDRDEHLVAKFYRPGRWTDEAILEEHRFLQQLAAAEVPVVAPLADGEGDTLFQVEVDSDKKVENEVETAGAETTEHPETTAGEGVAFSFALFPRRGGRSFDAEQDEDFFRLGSIVGRAHSVARREDALERVRLDPDRWTGAYVEELLREEVVHPECRDEFEEVALAAIDRIRPLFRGLPVHRLHGDCHRGNILDRSDEGLLLIDFDDMMMGPAVQDLWLLLPDHADEARREMTMLLEGYRQFSPFDEDHTALVEPLRFMRIIHFLAWRARQRHDRWFVDQFPGWGNRAFWIKEIEDLREQARYLGEQ